MGWWKYASWVSPGTNPYLRQYSVSTKRCLYQSCYVRKACPSKVTPRIRILHVYYVYHAGQTHHPSFKYNLGRTYNNYTFCTSSKMVYKHLTLLTEYNTIAMQTFCLNEWYFYLQEHKYIRWQTRGNHVSLYSACLIASLKTIPIWKTKNPFSLDIFKVK